MGYCYIADYNQLNIPRVTLPYGWLLKMQKAATVETWRTLWKRTCSLCRYEKLILMLQTQNASKFQKTH